MLVGVDDCIGDDAAAAGAVEDDDAAEFDSL